MTSSLLPDHESLPHPALERFLALPHSGERLLVVRAPAGTGPRRFAQGWTGAADRVLVWDAKPLDRTLDSQAPLGGERAVLEQVQALLEDPDAGRAAVVAGQGMPVGHLAAAFPTRFVSTRDLLLTVPEIQAMAARLVASATDNGPVPQSTATTLRPATHPPLPLTPRLIHEKTGGWFIPATILAADPLAVQSARHTLYSSLMHWLHALDRDGTITQAGYLPELTEEVMAVFRPEGFAPLPSLRELEGLGLVMRDDTGAWFMPWLIRDCLRESLAENHPDRVPGLVRAADRALAEAGEVESAVQLAVSGRAWSRLWDLLLEHWPELYARNAPALAAAARFVPRFVVGGMDTTGVLSRLLAVGGGGDLAYSPPSAVVEYGRDPVARTFRSRTAELYRRPDQQALTLGCIELSYLRQAGHFAESGEAAVRLKRALDEAMGFRKIKPVMAAVVELQSGISLHLADRLAEAKAAYEAAHFWARREAVDFVLADAAGKLALLSVQQGNTGQARQWLGQVDGPLSRLKWGRPTVALAAELARAQVALAEVDVPRAREILHRLPAEPTADEFWASHAAALALLDVYDRDQVAETVRWIGDLRRQRPVASRSPLARRLLDVASHRARLATGDTSVIPGWDRSEELAGLEALRCLFLDDPDGVLRALRVPERVGQRHRQQAALIGVVARSRAKPSTASPAVLRQLATIHARGGELGDLVAFHVLGWTPALRQAGLVDEADVARLSAVPYRPVDAGEIPALTTREHEVLDSLRAGMSRREIAGTTYRSENTIKGQIRSLYAKLGAASREEALDKARLYGL
jgi:LuxR family transcriptional regulator, maltose regulon positive regulatory protein